MGLLPRGKPLHRMKSLADDRRRQLQAEIDRLQRLARRGQWSLLAFAALSLAAVPLPQLLADLPEGVRRLLGPGPSPTFISLALVVYVFSALVLILSRMMQGAATFRGWSHLFYIGVFHLFYAWCRAPQENYWAVFAAGFTILSLEYFQLWNACSEIIAEKRTLLARLGPEEVEEEKN